MLSPKVVTLAAALAVAACAPRSTSPEARHWDAMSGDQRHAYMTSAVMPEMRSLFSAHDRGRYAQMTCATCHGKDGEARRWRMPNPDLLLEIEAVEGHSGMNAFMKGRVAPEMARLLGRSKLDCYGCHTLDR